MLMPDERHTGFNRWKLFFCVAAFLFGSGLGFALAAALSIWNAWTWGYDLPYEIMHPIHVMGVIIGILITSVGCLLAVFAVRKDNALSANLSVI